MKKLAKLCVFSALLICCPNLYADVNNPNGYNNNPAATAPSDNSLDESDSISSSTARPDDPEMQPSPSDNPGFQPRASANAGLQPGPSDNVGLQPEN